MTDSINRDLERIDRKNNDGRSGMPARHGAVALLNDVLINHRPLDTAFAASVTKGNLSKLEPRDRALARAIVATALRRKGQIEDLFYGLLERPMKGDTGPLLSIVLAAVAQLLFMGMSVHAVVNLAVEQCKKDGKTQRYAGLVNAVLRRIASSGPERAAGQDAAHLNTANWLWDRWSNTYGLETARAMAEAHLEEPPLDISVKSDPEGWAEKLDGIVLRTGSVRLRPKGRIDDLPGFDEGTWWVQDAAAALPARLLGDVDGKRVADLCAAPGGKTAQLASAGADVTAVDNAKRRVEMLENNLKRLGLNADCIEADAREWQPQGDLFDAILLDAPCSATGTIRRHPDIPHVKRSRDIPQLASLQARLLDHAVTLLRPGGTLVYCTCSLEPEEGEDQIRKLLSRNDTVQIDPIGAEDVAGQSEWLTADGTLRTLPHFTDGTAEDAGGMDGFFAARLTLIG